MGTHRIKEEIEKRVWLYMADRMATRGWSGGFTFSEAIDGLLEEAGF